MGSFSLPHILILAIVAILGIAADSVSEAVVERLVVPVRPHRGECNDGFPAFHRGPRVRSRARSRAQRPSVDSGPWQPPTRPIGSSSPPLRSTSTPRWRRSPGTPATR